MLQFLPSRRYFSTSERVPRLFGGAINYFPIAYETCSMKKKKYVTATTKLDWSKVYNWGYNKPRAECTTDVLMNGHVAELIPNIDVSSHSLVFDSCFKETSFYRRQQSIHTHKLPKC